LNTVVGKKEATVNNEKELVLKSMKSIGSERDPQTREEAILETINYSLVSQYELSVEQI
jgi:hypothetical protein